MVVLSGGLLALLTVSTASATRVLAGNLVLDFDGDFAPKQLMHTHDVPIKFWGHERLWTRDGSVPPALTHLMFEFDKHGHVETRGLPTCPLRKLRATTARDARKACPGSIVGTGFATAVIAFPDATPFSAGSSTTFFNAPPIEGDPAISVHAYLEVPVPTTYVDTFRIRRINKGRFGYRVESDTAKIAGGYGSLIYFRFGLGHHWRYKGKELSFLNARCPLDRSYLVGRGVMHYADGTTLSGSLLRRCQSRED